MGIYDNFDELKRTFKASADTIRKIEGIFEQGDYRYVDPWSAIIVAGFVDGKAIKIETEKIKGSDSNSEEEIGKIRPPQQFYKFVGKKHLEDKGYNLLGFECAFAGGKVDILAEKSSKNETVAVECCSCRISKAIDYLKKENTILWIIEKVEHPLSTELILHILKRGKTWKKYIKTYGEYLNKEMSKVTDLLDSL